MMALPEVQIELFEKGKGPRHTFKTKLQGWEANRLDLETIQNTYRLEAVYAYSITGGRGQRLAFHPRNGLSVVCYSGKPGAMIRLDSDPKTPIRKTVFRVVLGVLIATLAFIITYSDSYQKVRGRGGIGWIVAFILMVATQAIGWPFSRKT